jgi:hypothetical protein
VPNKRDKFSDDGPTIDNCLRDEVIHQEGHNLGEALKMFAYQTAFIVTYVVHIERGCVQSVFVDRLEVALKDVQELCFLQEKTLWPQKYFTTPNNIVWRISVGVSKCMSIPVGQHCECGTNVINRAYHSSQAADSLHH